MKRGFRIILYSAMVCVLMSKAQTIVAIPPQLKVRGVVGDSVVMQLVSQMVWVKGGMLHIDNEGRASVLNEGAVASVVLGDYYMGAYEVTREQWSAVMGAKGAGAGAGDRPVVNVSYDECVEFTKRLATLTGIPFQLPTENEWIYAERGGVKSRRFAFSGSDELGDITHYDNGIHAVGERLPNELGLYDMTGNAWEYCRDWWHEPQWNDGRYDADGSPSIVEGEIVRVYVIRRGALARKMFVDSTLKRSDVGFRLSVSL